MSDRQSRTAVGHTMAWFYQVEDLNHAKAEAIDARCRAQVYWGSALALQEAIEAEWRVATLEREIASQ